MTPTTTGHDMPTCPRGRRPRLAAALMVVVVAGAGCTADPEPADPTPTPSEQPTPTMPVVTLPPPTTPAEVDVPAEFAFQAPDPLCPPASEVDSFQVASEHPYKVSYSELSEYEAEYWESCGWRRADNLENEPGRILEDHINAVIATHLYRDWSESWLPTAETYPVWSDNLDDWSTMTTNAARTFREELWWEGCGRATECDDGQDPTVELHISHLNVQGRVANMLLDATIEYVATDPPTDVEQRIVAVLRDLVQTIVDGHERIE